MHPPSDLLLAGGLTGDTAATSGSRQGSQHGLGGENSTRIGTEAKAGAPAVTISPTESEDDLCRSPQLVPNGRWHRESEDDGDAVRIQRFLLTRNKLKDLILADPVLREKAETFVAALVLEAQREAQNRDSLRANHQGGGNNETDASGGDGSCPAPMAGESNRDEGAAAEQRKKVERMPGPAAGGTTTISRSDREGAREEEQDQHEQESPDERRRFRNFGSINRVMSSVSVGVSRVLHRVVACGESLWRSTRSRQQQQ